MDVTSAGAPAGPAAAATPAAAAPARRPGAGLVGSDFLQLLVAHLRYQDPLRPADGRELATQLAQLTAVDHLADQIRVSRTVAALGLLGRHVTAAVDGQEVSGTVTAVRLAQGQPVLEVAGRTVALDQVLRAALG